MSTTAPAHVQHAPPLELMSAQVRLYRLSDVLERIPISKSSWFAGIKAGRYPKGYRLGVRVTVWRSDEIDRLINECASLNPFAGLIRG